MSMITSTDKTLDARAVAHVDLSAVEHNCGSLKTRLEASELCAVVKADGYGHGAVECARAALAGGATWLAVVTAAEAAALREAGIDSRLLVMGALSGQVLQQALSADADLVVWQQRQLEAAAAIARDSGRSARLHVKLDTGMGRLGTPDPKVALALIEQIAADPNLEAAGFMTHFATADESGSSFFDEQLERFEPVARQVRTEHPDCIVHAANSAAVIRDRKAHFDMVRCGIAIYGLDPFHSDPSEHGLVPAMSLSSYVADVKSVAKGDSVGYGRSWKAGQATEIAVLPIGYGDGYRRSLSNRGEAIIAGRRFPVVGTVSMDNITVDVGTGSGISAGDSAVLIGNSSGQCLLAEDLAGRIDTINYEITCGISRRVPRVYRRGQHA